MKEQDEQNMADPNKGLSPEQSGKANPDPSGVQNWDKSDYMSKSIEKNRPEFERSNLNPDREKRNNSK